VNGPQCGWTALSHGIDTYGTRAGPGNAGPRCALAEYTGEAVAMASPDDSRAIAGVDGPKGGRPDLSLGIDTY
jgi:hypothetical protein